ncbi:hypothetical protein JTB14_034817 [Gonioctena quinquepunctata]|nr:hypothetical protein JTB14_034817 [Gonioctena quinquepunctata]
MNKSKKSSQEKKSLYQYDRELASAFKVDCDELLDEFEKLQSFCYVDFAKIWNQNNFTYVFAGQSYVLLLREFCENCFFNVKKYIMFPRTLFTQIGALYLLYGLYYKQPLKGWVKIRLTLEEYQKINALIQEMKSRRELDSVYIFAKMKVEDAFLYVGLRKQLGPEDRLVKRYQIYYNDTFTSSKTQSSLAKFQEICTSSELVDQLQTTNHEYQESLRKYSAKNTSISPFPSTIISDLQQAYRNFQKDETAPMEEEVEEEGDDETTLIGKRTSIRNRAMANKNAVYRGSKKIKTAVDMDMNEDSISCDSSD